MYAYDNNKIVKFLNVPKNMEAFPPYPYLPIFVCMKSSC